MKVVVARPSYLTACNKDKVSRYTKEIEASEY
jgi:hypothetical protein